MEPVGDAALQPGPAPDDLNAWKAPTYENGLGAPSGESSLWGAPAPAPEQDVVVETYQPPAALTFGSSDDLVTTCANSSSPLCYNTSISGANIITNLWFSAVLGLICYLGFVLFRAKFRLYQARLYMPTVTHKPPPLHLKGHRRWWSWLIPVFRVSDEDLLKTAGMDALIAVRIISFGILVFLPITIFAMAILIPINYTDNYYKSSSSDMTDSYTTVFIRLTMSNITPGSSVLWVHFVFVYGAVFWTCWLITEQYKEYISLRQSYVIRCTRIKRGPIGGSAEAFKRGNQPLITSRRSTGSHESCGSPPTGEQGNVGALPSSRKESLRGLRKLSLDLRDKIEARRKDNGTPLRILYGTSPNSQAEDKQCSISFQPYTANEQLYVGETSVSINNETSTCTDLSLTISSASDESFTGSKAIDGRLVDQMNPTVLTDMHDRKEHWTTHDFAGDLMMRDRDAEVEGMDDESVGDDAEIRLEPVQRKAALQTPESVFNLENPMGRQIQGKHTRASSAAVAAALETTERNESAAIALAKIRHHRAASGASTLSGNTNTPSGVSFTPQESPRKGIDELTPATLTPPKDLSRIILAVAEEPRNRIEEDENLATAVALGPEMCDPIGQIGISHHWWSYMAEGGSGKINDFDGQVNKAFVDPHINIHQSGNSEWNGEDSGEILAPVAINASLFTVLVTDQPIEKLRLKKPLKTMEFWQMHHRKSKVHESKENTTSEWSKAVESRNNLKSRAGTSVFHADVEAGIKVPDPEFEPTDQIPEEFKDSHVSERGMGITSGWSSTVLNLRQWWKHRGRYQEWRRDVRWAMFNRRARVATEMFVDLFGDDFDDLIPIYPTQSVDKLISQWDKKCALLERAQYDLQIIVKAEGDRVRRIQDDTEIHPNCLSALMKKLNDGSDKENKRREKARLRIASLKKKILSLNAHVFELQDKIAEERDSILSDLPSTCFFATFKSQEAAAIAAQANLNPVQQRLFNVQPAPSPDDVNWPTLTRSWWQRQSRPVIVLPLILFIMLLPIGAFTGAFAQLTIAICGSPADDSAAWSADSWYCSDDPWAVFFRNLMTSLAPTLLLSLYHMVVLPVLVYYAAQAEGQYFSLSKLDLRCASLFYYWDVFNVFLGAMLGGSVLAELPTFIQNPSQIWSALSSAIPASSNFFINYVSYRALVMAWFRLFYPHQGIMVSILKWMHILPWAKSAREKALEAPIRNCRYGRDIGIPVLMNFVMVMAYCVVSPLILPFGLLYFVLLWAVWRYQMLYVYQRQYESGGKFWPLVAHRTVGCAFICVLFTAIVLILKQAYTQAILMLISLPLYLLRFDMYLTQRYDAVVAQVPLMAVHKAARVESVDPDVWTPPPLRTGAEGWNPEWGKVWSWWGIPRYTI